MTSTTSITTNSDCPFCGCKVDPEGWLRGDGARGPECVGCGATAPSLQMWNSRVQPSALPLGATAEGDDADRAAFRAAYSQQVRVTQAAFMTNADGSFALPIVDMSWRMWQASATRLVTGGRQAEPVTLPSCKAKLNMSHDWDQGYSSGWKDCCEETTKLGPLYRHPDSGEGSRLRNQLTELASAVRSINFGPAHAIQVRGDDEPCYPQRKEWIEWLLGLCNAATESSGAADTYRLLTKADVVEPTDELLEDNATTWALHGPGPFTGKPYCPSYMVPMRRRVMQEVQS